MDRDKLEMIITHFQARARGFLVRSEVRRAREDFEEMVMEIDGGLRHLRWTEAVVSIPHFTDTDNTCLYPVNLPSESDLDAIPTLSPFPVSEEADHCVLVERSEAERDDSQTHLPRIPVREEEQEQKRIISGAAGGGVMESTLASPIWSSVELGANSHKGPRLYHLVQDVPRTPEALRLHRNTLTMELVWLQQAINSRKKYLSLKNRLSAS